MRGNMSTSPCSLSTAPAICLNSWRASSHGRGCQKSWLSAMTAPATTPCKSYRLSPTRPGSPSAFLKTEIASNKDMHGAADLAARQYDAAEERLAAMGLNRPVEGKTLARLSGRLEEKAFHLRSRPYLPRARALRLAFVNREICSRRYHRYSSGFRGLARDMFFRTREVHIAMERPDRLLLEDTGEPVNIKT